MFPVKFVIQTFASWMDLISPAGCGGNIFNICIKLAWTLQIPYYLGRERVGKFAFL